MPAYTDFIISYGIFVHCRGISFNSEVNHTRFPCLCCGFLLSHDGNSIHHMALFGTIWHYLALFGTIWHYLARSGTVKCHWFSFAMKIAS